MNFYGSLSYSCYFSAVVATTIIVAAAVAVIRIPFPTLAAAVAAIRIPFLTLAAAVLPSARIYEAYGPYRENHPGTDF